MKLSDELKSWGFHANISEAGKKEHIKMADRAAKLEAENDALRKITGWRVKNVQDGVGYIEESDDA